MIVAVAVALGNGDMHPRFGQYLATFDHEAHDGRGEATFTSDITKAMRWETMGEFHAFYIRSPTCRPTRWDGRPNRPLTATTWEIRSI